MQTSETRLREVEAETALTPPSRSRVTDMAKVFERAASVKNITGREDAMEWDRGGEGGVEAKAVWKRGEDGASGREGGSEGNRVQQQVEQTRALELRLVEVGGELRDVSEREEMVKREAQMQQEVLEGEVRLQEAEEEERGREVRALRWQLEQASRGEEEAKVSRW